MTSDVETNTIYNSLLINSSDITQKTSSCSEEILRIYQRAMAAAINGIVIVDASQSNLPVIYCNPAFEKTTGYTASEVIGKNCRLLQGKDTDLNAIAQIRQAIKEGRECCVVLKNYRKDGQHFWNELTISPVHDAQGKLTHFIGIQNDITERKEIEDSLQKAYEELEKRVDERTVTLKQMNEKLQVEITERQKVEAALRESEARFRAIFERAAIGIALVDMEGKPVVSNPALQKILGYSNEELREMTFSEFTYPDDVDQNQELYQKMITGDLDHYQMEKRYYRKDRQIVWANLTVSLVRDVQGKPLFAVSMVKNISDRKQAETALQLSQERLNFLLSSNPVVIYSCKASGDYGATFMSENVRSLFGYEPEEFVNDSSFWANHIHPEDTPRVFADLVHLFEHNYHNHEYRFLHKNGKYIWVYDQTKLIRDSQGNPLEILGYWADISDLKETEDKLKSSLKEKEVLLKEIHHRVKNNLQVISSLLKLQSGYINDPPTLALFGDSQNRVKAMALIHEKLYQSSDLARIPVSEYIYQLADNLVNSYALKANHIKLNISVDKIFLDVDTAIPCGLIINELLSNSLKYAFPNNKSGEIDIEFKLVEPEKLFLKISDNGIGLPANFQLEEAESLGLQLVSNLTEQLAGNLTVNSNCGTSFTIIFKPAFLRYISNSEKVR
ncbi:PAS domain S-box protein [Aerosakkonemataceae cyanobacterium BLCC-F154]|uniref:histidine kinase n=1 Tax=Floridaenema fluviatile BLCC-F154 TaxID=3153640 RepID=A0ABV4YK23_9CYAN